MSARRSAGASLTPSPVIATVTACPPIATITSPGASPALAADVPGVIPAVGPGDRRIAGHRDAVRHDLDAEEGGGAEVDRGRGLARRDRGGDRGSLAGRYGERLGRAGADLEP
jgi:hypothetical protein